MSITDEQIERMCEAATPGPWEVVIWDELVALRTMVTCAENLGVIGIVGEDKPGPDSEFIAVARELVPKLLKRAQKAEQLADVYRSELNQCMDSVRRQHEHLGKVTSELNGLRQVLRWVPVNERLPDEGEIVVVRYTSSDEDATLLKVAFLEDGQWYEVNDWDDIYNITHWLPLPDLPECELNAAIETRGDANER